MAETSPTEPPSARAVRLGLRGSARALHVAQWVVEHRRCAIVVCATDKDADAFHRDLAFFLGMPTPAGPALLTGEAADLIRYPADDFAPYDVASPDPEDATTRVEALWRLHAASIGELDRPVIVTTSLPGALRRTVPRQVLAEHLEYLITGEEIDREALLEFLTKSGYSRVGIVEDRGTFAVRGGILDIYPPLQEHPVRIEMFGDEVDSIRRFDIRTQRSKASLNELVITPVREVLFLDRYVAAVLEHLPDETRERDAIDRSFFYSGVETLLPWFYPKAETLFDYLPPGGAVFRVNPPALASETLRFARACWDGYEEAAADERAVPEPGLRFAALADVDPDAESGAMDQLDELVSRLRTIDLATLDTGVGGQRVRCEPTAAIRNEIAQANTDNMLEPLAGRIHRWQTERAKVVFVCHTPSAAERLISLLQPYRVHIVLDEEESTSGQLSAATSTLRDNVEEVTVLLGDLSEGFQLPDERLVIVPEQEVFGHRMRRRRARIGADAEAIRSLSDLKVGDQIVHRDYGVGLFLGVKQIESTQDFRPALDWLPGSGDGPAPPPQDFVHLEYLGGDKVYVPVYRMNLVQRYRRDEGAARLDKLGGTGWETRKKRVSAAVRKMAEELLQLYAQREVAQRPPYGAPEEMTRFEASFAYDETPDQGQAIEEVLADLSRDKPMDRLVCGDVGFGKTEVALRAAFRAAMNGRQVAMLVPTTILAQQHYRTFAARFEGYPVKIGLLSRFVTGAEQKQVLAGAADGTLDIVIGTHRILSKDVKIADLGLLIIDEEHRFGVAHKERIKTMRAKVDVLTLTATPIPRTLNMSMSGLRDLSVIETPPADRLPIRTFVTPDDDATVREAIMRELKRGGQVYFLHNRVQSIVSVASRVTKLVPEARLGIAHGQMAEKELAKVMIDFLEKRCDVLVCTAIIESGLDIPSANTLVVNRADQFGLAQLYQIRGRVGRSAQRAYAYLLVPGVDLITKGALDRLTTLQEFTELGSGFRIAERDMELRGVGNLLGANQHGHINAVGLDMYLSLLKNAVSELKGEETIPEIEPEINLRRAALIPQTYIDDAKTRVGYYRRLSAALNDAEVEELTDELRDRFGQLPEPVTTLADIIRIKVRLKMMGMSSLETGKGNLVFTLTEGSRLAPEALVAFVGAAPKKRRITPSGQLVVEHSQGDPVLLALETLKNLEKPAN